MKRLTVVFLLCACGGGGGGDDEVSRRSYTPPPPRMPMQLSVQGFTETDAWRGVFRRVARHDKVVVLAESNYGLKELTARFGRTVKRQLRGKSDRVEIDPTDLGDGHGTLTITARDQYSRLLERTYQEVLIDLEPPTIEAGPNILRGDGIGPSGTLTVRIADAWLLDSVQVELGTVRRTIELEEGFPSDYGETWDRAIVEFSAADFVPGDYTARITAFDAAGNETEEHLAVIIDGSVPTVQILSPIGDVIMSEPFTVEIASQDREGPTWIELRAAGTIFAEAAGPRAEIVIDPGELSLGNIELTAVARDRAGNESSPATVNVVIE